MTESAQVTAILLTHDCEAYAAEALRSVLAQDSAPMEILISDDASVDGTLGVLRREVAAYHGPHRVRLERREQNTGSKSAHLNEVLASCTGEILVSFDGDDVSEPHRVRLVADAFQADRRVQAVYSSYLQTDAAGRARGTVRPPQPPLGQPASRWFARVDANAPGATLAVSREVIERFPPLDPQIAEDLVLPFRASLLGEVAFLDEPLVRVRRHAASLTTELERFESVEKHRARIELGIVHAERNLESRKADLRVAERLFPDRVPELRALEGVAAESLRAARLTAALSSPSPAARLATFLRLLRSGAYPEHRGRHTLLAISPRLYLRYKRRSLGISPGSLRDQSVRVDETGPP